MADGVVYKRVRRVDAGVVADALTCTVADLHEGMGPAMGRLGLMTARMRPILAGARIAGPAVTAACAPGDNLMMHKALYLAQKGDVLVVSAGGCERGAQWGDVAALYAKTKGLAGIVVDGAIRDVDMLREMGFPAWSTAISPAHPDKKTPGAVNVPVVCDGVIVRPGDLIVADGDGVLVMPRDDAAAAVKRAKDRVAVEEEFAAKIRAGAHLYDLAKIGAEFDRLGIPEHDRAWDDT